MLVNQCPITGHTRQSVSIPDKQSVPQNTKTLDSLSNSAIHCPIDGHVKEFDDSVKFTEFDGMLAPAITHANAREMQARAVLARKRNQAIAKQAEEIAEAATAQPEHSAYANKLAYAQDKLLNELLSAESAKDKAALSQALKNLRETYHMATGAPKPGTIKPERISSRQQQRQPTGPKLDTPTGSVPTDSPTPQ